MNNLKRISYSIVLAVFLFVHHASPEIIPDDVLCLQGIKGTLQNPQESLNSWHFINVSAGSICSFNGITCWNNTQNFVRGINLTLWDLSGQIPESLKFCTTLQSLDLSKNNLYGSIPSELCAWMPDLETLDFSYNNLSGSIPADLANCSSLKRVSLASNHFSGRIPPNLTTFGKNSFVGNIGLCGEPLGRNCGSERLKKKLIIIVVTLGVSTTVGFILLGLWWFKFRVVWREADDFIEHDVPGMPRRFSYREIKYLTENFNTKLGEGGFGSVFAGTLRDGEQVAVKRLDGLGHIKESFFAEVKSIGSIHHVNLVRLIGFCIEKSHRLLVYVFMENGSLDRWLFGEVLLTWQHRKKIILDIAKGLNYLHVECHHKIIHLDIKPQNILLDENFNAKVSDFGLSKLIDRDQSRVMTTLRGTPGYLAPEWLNGIITEKADVYSFGVVVLEIVCGKKVFDLSRSEEDWYLLTLLRRKKEENRLLDIVGVYGDQDDEVYGVEAVKMLKLAAWCLQGDYTKRPSMSMAIKVLEEGMEVEDDLDYNFWGKPVKVDESYARTCGTTMQSAVFSPSILSAPR